ncbi:MAG: hypothetical protein RIS80_1192, partial [Actinomycetota bacterium]
NAIGLPIASSRALGDGMFALTFKNPTTEAKAGLAVDAALRDPRIKSASIDHHLELRPSVVESRYRASIAKLASFIPPSIRLTAIAASAPTSLTAMNAFNPQNPRSPRVKLTWVAPKSLNGGSLTGYRVERSTNGTSWSTLISTTASSATSVTISSGLTPGASVQFRVRALTRVESTSKISLPSRTAAAAPIVAPLECGIRWRPSHLATPDSESARR